jgi:hypothetical protein
MNKATYLSNAILWASAIIAAAILNAPSIMTTVLLPSLAVASLILNSKMPESKSE